MPERRRVPFRAAPSRPKDHKLTTPVPAQVIDKGIPTSGLLAQVLVHQHHAGERTRTDAFGGMGYAKELPLERIYRDARVMRIYDGTSEIHRMITARTMLKNGIFQL